MGRTWTRLRPLEQCDNQRGNRGQVTEIKLKTSCNLIEQNTTDKVVASLAIASDFTHQALTDMEILFQEKNTT